MNKPKSYRVTVAGKGKFPIDMLRYDSAIPHSETDSGLIASAMLGLYRDVDITLEMPRQPERERWASFGWTVKHVMGQY